MNNKRYIVYGEHEAGRTEVWAMPPSHDSSSGLYFAGTPGVMFDGFEVKEVGGHAECLKAFRNLRKNGRNARMEVLRD